MLSEVGTKETSAERSSPELIPQLKRMVTCAGAEPVVECDVIAVELHPAGLVVGDLDVEIDIGPDLDVEVAFVERGVVFDIDRRLVERDGVIESLLFDSDFLVFGAVPVLTIRTTPF